MSIEKNKEELKEQQINDIALSDEELEQGNGGVIVYLYACTNNNCFLYNKPIAKDGNHICPYCGSSMIKVGHK